MQVSTREFRLKASEFIRRARDGETVVIANRGVPVARLTAPGEASAALSVREPRAAYAATAEADAERPGERAGVRELKTRLPDYMRLVKSGTPVTITDRGKEVARLLTVHGGLEQLQAPAWARPEDARRMEQALIADPPSPELVPLIRAGRLLWKGRFRAFPRGHRMRPGDGGKTSTDYLREIRES
jgi:prevent-host-death family protein